MALTFHDQFFISSNTIININPSHPKNSHPYHNSLIFSQPSLSLILFQFSSSAYSPTSDKGEYFNDTNHNSISRWFIAVTSFRTASFHTAFSIAFTQSYIITAHSVTTFRQGAVITLLPVLIYAAKINSRIPFQTVNICYAIKPRKLSFMCQLALV